MGISSEPDTVRELTGTSRAGVRRRYRVWSVLVAFATPTLVVLGSGAVLLSVLPEHVAFHWDASGRPDGQVPTAFLFWACIALSVVVLVFGVLARFIPGGDQQDTRKAATLVGCIAGLVAVIWLVPAITTGFSASTHRSGLDGWHVLLLIGPLYGAVTRWVTPPELVENSKR